MSADPIFIIGAERSGTTLLRLMLTSHPGICIPPESTFLLSLARRFEHSSWSDEVVNLFVEKLYGNKKFSEWQLDRSELTNTLRINRPSTYPQACEAVYVTYLKQIKPEAHIWGDKNPRHLFYTDFIRKQFPAARLIHIIRDVRGIYNSLLRLQRDAATRDDWKHARTPMLLATRYWARSMELIKDSDKNIYHLRFEDLVNRPEEELRRLCEWLGIDYMDSMMGSNSENKKNQLIPPHRLKWHGRTLEPVDSGAAHEWKAGLTGHQIAAIEFLNRNRFQTLGYTKSRSHVSLGGLREIAAEYGLRMKKRLIGAR